MEESRYLVCNGEYYKNGELFISPNNRSFRYGDGCFETMKSIKGAIILEDFHLERLFSSLQLLQFSIPSYFTPKYLKEQIQSLLEKNEIDDLARVRLMVYRGDGSLHDIENNEPNYLLQCWKLSEFPSYKKEGLVVDFYKDASLPSDAFSSIKSNNYLRYAMAAMWSKKMGKVDALLLNCYGHVAEATTSNVFIVKDNVIKTPSLKEGCIAGITRRYLLDCFAKEGIEYEETSIKTEDVLEADEVFLTNAGWYIQWVAKCGDKNYTSTKSEQLYNTFINPLIGK